MIKKLLCTLLLTFFVSKSSAISVGMIGDFNSWGGDIAMTTTDNITYSITDYTFLVTGGVKFRQDGGWTTSWGGDTFPTGGPGSGNIPVPAGSYDITLDITTGAYTFTVHPHSYDSIGIYGGFNSWATPSTPLITTDGVTYVLPDNYFSAADAKFIKSDDTAQTWSAAAFPTGVATLGGATIPVTVGYYNVGFNNTTKAYYFIQTPISLIGSGVSDWSTDVDMDSADGGINSTLTGITLMAGEVKFRANHSWASNWGGSAFPTGTGSSTGGNIPVSIPGTYDVAFNRQTGVYTFTLIAAAYPVLDFNGTTLATTDGVTYTGDLYVPSATTSNFVNHNDAAQFWGGTAFPIGTATAGSTSMIPVPAGYFSVSFNSTTGAYSFTVPMVSMIGSGAVDWSTDVDMTTSDNGLTYTASNVVIVNGELKFRLNHAWGTAWGGTTFPTGGPGTANIPTVAGTYNVTFDRTTGMYTFTDVLSVNQFGANSFSLYPNPTKGAFTINGNFDRAEVYNITGQLVKTFNGSASQLSISELNSGIYLVRVSDSDNNTKTLKLVKE